eukprot:Plantae.Rhodophyta-Purpureofilum_apyrenoidigerum.ctg14017.p1 GENE.Plantae.Rhodophyta-Purpureofilum_apyrenoidigerum.ctg14017~~Plantae.Rhodophyta-Purpureofilum_apyrenoidigerum.ctg14017.p1  ORF type:complete len:1087 (-),score=225.16 Plantae.Rhodophyta-Purpureofilum_apyrenoidigerum.ctg14017:29-3289(-)
MERLLDPALPNNEFLDLLERVIQVMYSSPNEGERNQAQAVLTRLQEIPDSWVKVDKVLDDPRASENSKFYALQILGDMIRYRWQTLNRDTQVSIRDYVVRMVIELSSDEARMSTQRTFLTKLNWILVQVVKQEWPTRWRSFMSDIVGASKTSTSRCENNLQILALLSEEVFQFSAGQMTQEKIKNLKDQFNKEFASVFELCLFVFDQSTSLKDSKPSLLIATLNTLERFLIWIPVGFIFETHLLETLISCLALPVLRNHALKCLVEISLLSIDDVKTAYAKRFCFLYVSFMERLVEIVPIKSNIEEAYESVDDDTQTFIMDLALFLSGYFRNNLKILEQADDECRNALLVGLEYLVHISVVSEVEVFKACLEFWHQFCGELFTQNMSSTDNRRTFFGLDNRVDNRQLQVYSPILSALRRVVISRVPKPQEVLIVEDENGEIVRETIKDSDSIALYKTMRETLVYLTHLNIEDTENIMLEKLSMQLDGTQWSWQKLNTLCWAIGSISGAMTEDEEKKFLVTVVKDLLQLCEMKRGRDNKAVVASNIMYVVGQYPRFLRTHWKFLKTVVNKLFEFMHETHPGVQDMACDTFLKIAQKCRRKFIYTQMGESQPFIDEMLNNLHNIIEDLEPHQVHSFYEACGTVISEAIEQTELVVKLFRLPNATWQQILDEASADSQVLRQRENTKSLLTILKTNTRVATALGPSYFVQLQWIFPAMMRLYMTYSAMLTELIGRQGPIMAKSADARNMRAVKRETLKVIEAFLSSSEGHDKERVKEQIIDPMTEPILKDYYEAHPDVRDAEVLSLFSQVISFMNGLPVPAVRLIFKSLFECTLEMIKNNFEDFPDARLNFFVLLRAINRYNFSDLFLLDDNPSAAEAEFKLVINAIVWAFKHTERNVAETGLVILLDLLKNVDDSLYVSYFYQTCFRLILNDILSVLTDTLHRPGFKIHAQILMHMLMIIVSGMVTEPMWNVNSLEEVNMAGNPPSNRIFIEHYLNKLLGEAFTNMTPMQIERVVQNLLNSLNNEQTFKGHLRDFLIQTKEFRAGDNTDLYDEERQAEMAEKQQAEAERLAKTPGLAPLTLDDSMADS